MLDNVVIMGHKSFKDEVVDYQWEYEESERIGGQKCA